MPVSKLFEFIQSDVPSNTLLLIPNEFRTVFESLEALEELIFVETRKAGARKNFAQQLCIEAL